MPRRVLLLVNQDKPEARGSSELVAGLISTHGVLVDTRPASSSPDPGDAGSVDLVVVLGGDGTLLAQSRRYAPLGIPLLGVNFGKLGFMADYDVPSLSEQAPAIFGGEGGLPPTCHELPLLSVRVHRERTGETVFDETALNEALIAAGPPFRMITLALGIDGHPGPTFSGDGLILSTPAGSTAYSLSAGGPIVAPGLGAIVITAIAAHTLSFRPLVVPDTTEVDVTIERANAAAPGYGSTLVLDGHVNCPLERGDRVKVRRSGVSARFVRNPAGSYWQTLIEKLNWGQRPRLRLDGA